MLKTLLKVIIFGCIGLTALGVIANLINGGTASRETAKAPQRAIAEATSQPIAAVPAATFTASAPEVTSAPASVSDLIAAAASKACGDRVIKVEHTATQTSIDCKLGDNLTDNMIVGGATLDLYELTQAIMPYEEVKSLQFRLIGDFKDKYGNESQLPAFGFRVPKALYKKINWKNTLNRDFCKLLADGADGSAAVVHPAWRELWRAWLNNE